MPNLFQKTNKQTISNTPQPLNNFTWKIGGEAGMGIMVTGQIFAKICSRAGLNIFGYTEYPSLIRGGHNTYHARVSDRPFYCQKFTSDLLVALNKETIDLHKNEVVSGGGILYDNTNLTLDLDDIGRSDVILLPIPLIKLANDSGGGAQMINTVAIGASFGMVNLNFEAISEVVSDVFKSKGQEIIDTNIKAARLGYDFAENNLRHNFPHNLKKIENASPKIVVTGNEAIALGAIRSGCKFYAAYPMTPTSNILHFFASHEKELDMVVRHGEDEIGVVNMAVGAAFAGVRSMVASAGGGFSLMVETFGLAAITETPLIIVVGQRPGPATGLPTWTGQADLKFVLSAAQDEFPRIVIAPGDVTECFYHIASAFNIAEKFQTPVIFLVDKHLAESNSSTDRFDPNLIKIDRGKLLNESDLEKMPFYHRYQLTEDGVSPRVLPGQKKGQFVANSDEHDEAGFSTEDALIRRKMMDKRMKKLVEIAKILPPPKIYGSDDADLTIIAWGSNKGVCLEVVMWAANEGIRLNFIHPLFLNPFPSKTIEEAIGRAKKTLIIENNYTGQLESLIREQTGKSIDFNLRKFDGRPFYPEEIYQKVKQILQK